MDVFRYWRADLRPAPAPSEGSAASILAVMRDSIAVHLRSDAPLGAFLSGGIDSAAICALAAEHRPDLLTFTVGFEREGYSEIDRAQETAAALGVKSIPYVISAEEFFTHLPRIIWHLDDPMADAAAVPLWFVAREASRHVKVVLSGEGSDELFGGYAIYHQPGLVRAGERLPELARAPLKRAASMIPAGVKGKGFLERTSTPLRERYIGNAHVFVDSQVDLVARGPGSPAASAYAVTAPVYDQAAEAGLDDTSTMQLVDINTWLHGDILVKADRMTMAHSLELRVPFLDREVMAVAARLAREEKIGGGTTKLALRQAMGAVLPQAAAERAKLGFPVPIGHWLKGEMYGWAERLLREARTDEWIDRDAALSLLERFRAGEPDVSWRHIWVLIVFSLWHQIYVERVYDPAALGWEHAPRAGKHLVDRSGRADWPMGLADRGSAGHRGQARTGAGPVRGQLVAQPAAAAVQPRHHRADRGAHDLGDLLVGVALDIGQVHRDPELLGQVPQRAQDLRVGQPVERLRLGRPGLGGQRVRRHLPFLEVAAGRLPRLTAPLAVGVDERVGQDAVQPGLQVGARTELVERGVRLGRGLLDEVLGVRRVAGHAKRSGVQLTEERHDVLLEPPVPVRCLFASPHAVTPLLGHYPSP